MWKQVIKQSSDSYKLEIRKRAEEELKNLLEHLNTVNMLHIINGDIEWWAMHASWDSRKAAMEEIISRDIALDENDENMINFFLENLCTNDNEREYLERLRTV
jgi:hypothetical protein